MKSAMICAVASLATVTLAGAVYAQGSTMSSSTTLKASSAAYVKAAAEGGQAEVTLAKTAQEKASNSQVKTLAESIQKDHEQSNAELTTLAGKKNLTLPTTPSKPHQETADRLGRLSGSAFDKAYVDEMVKDHRADIAECQKHEKDPDPDVAAWASKTLPVLQNHLTMALNAQKAVGGSK
jgi:putative membrane protein